MLLRQEVLGSGECTHLAQFLVDVNGRRADSEVKGGIGSGKRCNERPESRQLRRKSVRVALREESSIPTKLQQCLNYDWIGLSERRRHRYYDDLITPLPAERLNCPRSATNSSKIYINSLDASLPALAALQRQQQQQRRMEESFQFNFFQQPAAAAPALPQQQHQQQAAVVPEPLAAAEVPQTDGVQVCAGHCAVPLSVQTPSTHGPQLVRSYAGVCRAVESGARQRHRAAEGEARLAATAAPAAADWLGPPPAQQSCVCVLCAQGLVSSEYAAAMLADPQLEASDLVPNKYEGRGADAHTLIDFVQAHLLQLPKELVGVDANWLTSGTDTRALCTVNCLHLLCCVPACLLCVCMPGGFKLWEGAVDLCNYLIQQQRLTADSIAGRNTDSGLKVCTQQRHSQQQSLKTDHDEQQESNLEPRSSMARTPSCWLGCASVCCCC